MFIDSLSVLLILAGMLFFFGASVGIVRFPDFYTRMHAAGKGDTLSTVLITAGLAVQMLHHLDLEHALIAIKVLGIGILIMMTSPTSTHALMQAGYDDGIEPVARPSKKGIHDLGGPFLKDAIPPAHGPKREPRSADGRSSAPARKRSAKKAAKKVGKKAAKKTSRKKAAKKTSRKKAAKKTSRKKVAKKAARKSAPKKKATGRKKD